MAGAGSWWENPSTPFGVGELRDRPVSLRKHLRSQKEKQSIAERLNLSFTLVPRKSPLGYYLGRLVPSKTCSFRQRLPVEASLGIAWQPVVHSPNTITSRRASAGAWRANTALRTGHVTDQTQLKGSRILLPPTKPALGRVRPISSPRAVMLFELHSPAAQEPKPTSRHKHAVVKPAINARRAQLAEWQAAKGKVLKRPPCVMVPVPPKRCLSKEPAVLSSWTTIMDEEEMRSEPDQASLAVLEQPSQAGGGTRREEVPPWDPATRGTQDSEYWVHLQQPAGAAGSTCLAGKGPEHLVDEECGSARAVDNGKRLLYASMLQISVWKRLPKLPLSAPHPSSLAAE
ncbi:cytoskeleton-associated protein 2-like [Dermochelys coriacea]|uniref:cytoskeleton-associated protein 2-like n=1 Tax=Dermochelys coriacea TaxID=27794 RepID=UPI0018E7DE3C|nr:cytoskeleton-associated protein 2-like [Dermochelys coriacea]XP_043374519.1 cytoskeleton-associated protein 2-like [Dermochelys coriacea]